MQQCLRDGGSPSSPRRARAASFAGGVPGRLAVRAQGGSRTLPDARLHSHRHVPGARRYLRTQWHCTSAWLREDPADPVDRSRRLALRLLAGATSRADALWSMNTSADTCGHCDPPDRGASACDTRGAMPAVAAPRLPAVAGARETMSLPIDLADQVIEIVAPTRPFAASNSPDLELLAARASSPTGTFGWKQTTSPPPPTRCRTCSRRSSRWPSNGIG